MFKNIDGANKNAIIFLLVAAGVMSIITLNDYLTKGADWWEVGTIALFLTLAFGIVKWEKYSKKKSNGGNPDHF